MNKGIVKLSPSLLALLGTEGEHALAPFSREIFLLDIMVAGTSYCEKIEEYEPFLVPSTVLKMLRHPKNEHDEQAIAIYWQNNPIGWVPQNLNLIISRLMDAGKAFFARIEKTERKGKWLKINAKVYMVE
jgi:hypothetical protein